MIAISALTACAIQHQAQLALSATLQCTKLGDSELAGASESAQCPLTKPDFCIMDGDLAAHVAVAALNATQWAAVLCIHCGTVSTLQTIQSTELIFVRQEQA